MFVAKIISLQAYNFRQTWQTTLHYLARQISAIKSAVLALNRMIAGGTCMSLEKPAWGKQPFLKIWRFRIFARERVWVLLIRTASLRKRCLTLSRQTACRM